MGEHRMLSTKVVESDEFLDLGHGAQCLFVHLVMGADDRGIVDSPRGIMRACGATLDDAQALFDAGFLIGFESSKAVLVKHWLICNKLRKDRIHETHHTDLLAQIYVDDKNQYTLEPTGVPVLASQPLLVDNLQPNDTKPQPTADKPQPNGAECQPEDKNKLSISKDKNKLTIKDKLTAISGDDKELFDALDAFVDMRKKIRKPLTDRAVDLLIKGLEEHPRNQWVAVLNQSIEHSWSGIYPLKQHGGVVTASCTGIDELAMRAMANRRRAKQDAEQVQSQED